MYQLIFLFISLLFYCPLYSQQSWQSKLVQIDALGKLKYSPDKDGFVLPDFSHAGYQSSNIKLPTVANTIRLNPLTGDNTAHIQAAIDALAAMPLDEKGFRGAIFLSAGTYPIHGQLRIEASGIVLRGAGKAANPSENTILYGVGNTPQHRDLIIFGSNQKVTYQFKKVAPFAYTSIADSLVPVGSRTFEVYRASNFKVGDRILIAHTCSKKWLTAIHNGGVDTDTPWAENEHPIIYDRQITAIADNQITIDAPVFYSLNKRLATTRIYPYPKQLKVIEHVGLENIRIDNSYRHSEDEKHVRNSVVFRLVNNGWVKNCTATHFLRAGFSVAYSKHISILNTHSIDPISKVDGARRYNFELAKGAQLVLIKNCYARNGRHHFIADGGGSISGCVIYNCISDAAYTTSESHRHWATGLLFDNVLEINPRRPKIELLGLHNRGSWGQAHGWSSAHCVAWNYDVGIGEIVLHQPPTAQNYAIGCKGLVSNDGNFKQPLGYVEGTNRKGLLPKSLYLAQLKARKEK